MEPERTQEEIDDLRDGRDRGLGEEGRTPEEQDQAMTPEQGGAAEDVVSEPPAKPVDIPRPEEDGPHH